MNNQNVYAAILTFKMFRILIIFMIAFNFETKQLNVVNAFLNANNNEVVYCYFSNDFKQSKKIMKMIKALYDQKKSFFLWLRALIIKYMKLKLYQIFDKSCLFTNNKGIFLFFYVDNIVFVYRLKKQNVGSISSLAWSPDLA